MPLDNWSGISLRRCSLETFSKFVNQEFDLDKLALIGGLILNDWERNNRNYNIYIRQYLQQEYLINTNEEKEAKLKIIRNRREYILLFNLNPVVQEGILEELDQQVDNIVNE